MVQLIGDDPLPFTVKERWIEYSDGVRFAHTNHGQTSDSLMKGNDYYGKNSVHFSSAVNGIHVYVVQKPQVNVMQAVIKTKLKRTTKMLGAGDLYYLKTIVEAPTKFAIHQITIGQMKREMFNEAEQTINSFTGVQFKPLIINVVFATLETGKPTDFTADEAFLKKIQAIVASIGTGKTCAQFFCIPPKTELVAKLAEDLPVIKIQCAKAECSYSVKGQAQPLFTKIPFLQTKAKMRYLDKALSGMLMAVVPVDKQPFVSVTAQFAQMCNIKDLDYHKDGYSAAVQSISLGDQKLFTVLIIEPGYDGIKRTLKQQSPELFDMLEGIEKVKAIYFFMIVSDKNPETVFNDFIAVINKAKVEDQKKYQCTLPKVAVAASFLQIQATFNTHIQRHEEEVKKHGDQEYDYEYYDYVYDYDGGQDGYDGYDYEEEYYNEYDQPAEENDAYDGGYDYDNDKESDNKDVVDNVDVKVEEQQPDISLVDDDDYDEPQSQSVPEISEQSEYDYDAYDDVVESPKPNNADSLISTEQELCFEAYQECMYSGTSLAICGHQPSVPAELQNFLIRSLKIPNGMRITFFTQDQKKIVLSGNQECLDKPFEIANLGLKNKEMIQLSHNAY